MNSSRHIHIHHRGFLIYIVIISVAIFGIFMFVIFEILDTSSNEWSTAQNDVAFNTYAQSRAGLLERFDAEKNSDGNVSDTKTCSWGRITAYADGITPPVCSVGWSAGSDGIPDGVDNDNYRPSFMTGAVPMGAFSSWSRLEDDDDLARTHSMGFVPPGQTETVFVMDDSIKNIISLNANNELVPTRILPSLLTGPMTLSYHVSSLSGTVDFITSDKSVFNATRQLSIVSSHTGTILTLTGTLLTDGSLGDTGITAPLDISRYDYAVNITNTGTGILSYDIWSPYGTDGSTYITPIDDSSTPRHIRIVRYDPLGDGQYSYRMRDITY